ncbi:MAG: ABC transporter ATP-binding protein [Candidatus Heimdallarchaeota archaeon]|nr:ABC transporter ATP-binding protein [Candidatus Heimdallarchaeota archaeon]
MSYDFINLNQVTKAYRDPASDIYFQALRGIDLTIREGTLSSIIGPSGAGKSTLLNILGGMTKPSTGTITVDGLPIHSLDESGLNYYRRKITGFLWQLPERNLLPHLSAEDNILYSMEVAGYPRNSRKSRVDELLEAVGLKDRRKHKLGQLSGGEAQRISLAVALANEPKLLLADEPTGELDSETTLEIISYLQQLNKEQGVTIVVVTHDNRFERLTNQSFNILDGTIAGLRRSLNGGELKQNWRNVQREEISVVNQYGQVRIPNSIIEKLGIKGYLKFVEDEATGKVYIEPVDHS